MPEPVQAPSQFMKTLPLLGVCVIVTAVLSAYANVQIPLTAALLSVHVRPEGALLSTPPPCEPVAAESASVGGAANVAVMLDVAPGVVFTVQLTPEQAPV